jgi:N-acylneuraminate cytidylyltransferase
MNKSVGLILAKSDSRRLEGKNLKEFHGKPMFMWNVEKCIKIFDKTFVSSNDQEILNIARMAGAEPIWRDEDLCGDTPNIPVYQHALKEMGDIDSIVAVQACSPTVSSDIINKVKTLMAQGFSEVMTCHPVDKGLTYHDRKYPLYGSVWGISKWLLEHYQDPFDPHPEALIVDPSVDIHNYQDYIKALKQWQ